MKRSQQIRHEALRQLYGSGPISLSIAHIHKVAACEGFQFSERELRDQLHFLIGQNLVQTVTLPGSGETRYQITSRGMLAYEEEEV